MFVCGTIELNERRRHLKIHGHTKINDTSMYRVSYDPTKKWKATGFQIEFGKTYHIEAKAVPDAQGRPYSDKGLRSTPDGASTLVGSFLTGWRGMHAAR
jgi:hypothetical protein